ncbi:hypothetical protein FB451DRAFT_324461 [Mycena latifolia]|nr:hypothetical protein FB451DRAFT_324461 [Mycena latifolia]
MSSESPFASKFGTNHCPSDEEVAEIKVLLVNPTLQLRRLDDEIAAMQKAIDKLTEERDRIGAYVEAHNALISPVRRLPLDIIQEIFMACIPTHRNCVMSAREAPVLLGRICSAWRAISLSTPNLWARLHIVEPTRPRHSTPISFEEKLAQRLETTKMWLGRSGHCALSISLESSLGYYTLPEESAPPDPSLFLQALIPFAHRWQHIHFTIPPMVLQVLSHLAETDVPILESVALYENSRHGSHNHDWRLFGMLRGSKISSFSIPGSSFRRLELPLRWNQLTVLSITGTSSLPTIETILETLSRCPELRSCNLTINDHSSAEIQSSIVELLFLHTFELHYISCPFTRLLERLSMPELRKFSLRGKTGVTPFTSQMTAMPVPLGHLFAESTHLESLELEAYSFSKSSLLEIFRCLSPTMQRLNIVDGVLRMPLTSGLDDETLALLTPASGSPALSCPALQQLIVTRCRNISDAALLRFITSRMADGPHPKLKRVEIKFDRQIQLEILPTLQPLIETGLHVAITYLPHIESLFSPWQGLADAPTLR